MIILQSKLSLEDSEWHYKHVNIPNHKPSKTSKQSNKEKVRIKFISVTEEKGITLHIMEQTTNRVLTKDNAEHFIGISFEKFQFKEPDRNKTAGYVEKLLKAGIKINGKSYWFYGHSNSQLRKKTCYLLAARCGGDVFKKINEFGDFTKMASVAKRAKRIGLLFSAVESNFQLDEKKFLDIDDIEENGHVFTDGCGLLSRNYAKHLASTSNLIFHNKRYTPSVYQIRYKGYKGTLMVVPELETPHHVHFRDSMKKFTSCPDNTFSILDYSKPYTFGYLNGELVTLLSTLGISDETFLRKQQEYFSFSQQAQNDPYAAFIFLSYKGEHEMAEQVLLDGITPVSDEIRRLQKQEWKGCYDKKDKEKVRIMIRKSRLLYGVADYTGSLKEGEVLVRITIEGKGVLTLEGAEVIVGRNPCLHPGDIRKFKAVRNDVLGHLEDCIVFPTIGKRDAPSLMSGGDLDGDRFFVSWDSDIIPEKLYEPYGYPAAKETPRADIKQEDMIRYFANYNNASLGKVKNLYLSWAKSSINVAGSKQCQELNALFSSCVDGERITIPEHLQSPPKPSNDKLFILDALCEAVKIFGDIQFQLDPEGVDETPEELLENLLISEAVCLKEFDLFQMANRWCRTNQSSLENYLHCFDFGAFTHQQKHLAMQQFENNFHKEHISRLVYNGLLSSNLLSQSELREANLDDRRIHWQKLYSSDDDKGLRLGVNVSKALELFERKFIVFQVDVSLRVGLYISRKLLKGEELFIGDVKDSVKLFAFVESGTMYKTWTNENYKLYFDGDMMQLFDKKRSNTFVWLGLQSEKFPSKNLDTEFKVSIALQKFSGQLQKSRTKVTKEESKGMELYVLSNRDRVGHQILDITMSQRDTTEIIRLLEDIPKEYTVDIDLNDISWENREFCQDIVIQKDFTKFANLSSICEWEQIFHMYHSLSDEKLTLAIVYVVNNFNSFELKKEIWLTVFKWLEEVPIISCLITEALSGSQANIYPMDRHLYNCLVHAVIQTANFGKELALDLLKNLIRILVRENIRFVINDIMKMVKSIVYCVRHTNVANELLNLLFDEDSNIFEITDEDGDQSVCFNYFKKFTLALAKDYIGEVNDKCPCDNYGIPHGAEDTEGDDNGTSSRLETKSTLSDFLPKKIGQAKSVFYGTKPGPTMKCLQILSPDKNGFYKLNLRTDVVNKIRSGDHLRFCASRRSTDAPNRPIWVFDAIADAVQNGVLSFKLKQTKPRELYDASWNVYTCGNTTTFNAMLSAMKILITLKTESTVVFKSILGLPQERETLKPIELKEATIPPNKFNENQEKAIQEALNNPLTLVWGPPGKIYLYVSNKPK